MLTQKKVLELLKKDFPYLRSRYNVKRIGLFGSFAKELQHKKSDIDLFIEFQKPIGLDFVDLTEHIEDVLGKKVDAITPEGIKGIRIKEVADSIKGGIIYV